MTISRQLDRDGLARWAGVIPAGAIALGLFLVASAFAIDIARGESIGLGVQQTLLALAGVAAVLTGIASRRGEGQRHLANWLLAASGERREAAIKFAGILAQLGLMLLVIRAFEIENKAFSDTVVVLAFAGFAMHFFLPQAYRMVFFLALSFSAIYLMFGLADGLWMVAAGIGLIGICLLPFAFWLRVGLLIGAGAAMMALRNEWLQAPWSRAVWPILGSMFMFRLIVFMYDLKHAKEKPGVVRTLSYFFLLPNVVFPLFPVVDFSAFKRNYYDADRFEIYQRGVAWMFRGLTHLIFYRFVYHYMTLSPSDVTNVADLGRYMVANFLLYVRVSGQFHFIIGLLHLFGFHLPETNHKYLLSANFSDYWRRINIYWKDFMMKVVFYPVYFAWRKAGEQKALVLGTLSVFFVTWFLHAYQWFWLLGEFPVRWTDTLFWGSLALLLVANTLYESKHGRKRTVGGSSWSWNTLGPRILKTGATFATIVILWSFWTSPTLDEWFGLLSGGLATAGTGGAGVPFALIAGLAVGGGAKAVTDRRAAAKSKSGFTRSFLWTMAGLAFIYVAGSPAVSDRFGEQAGEVAQTLRSSELNAQDMTLLQRGYYENLMGVSRFNSQLWELYMDRPPDQELIWQTDAARRIDNFMGIELVPSVRILLRGTVIGINQWGMRDREYDFEKPEGVLRIAMAGASTTMGWGVNNDETYEQLLEDRLTRDPVPGSPDGLRYEILNFAVPGFTPPQYLGQLDRVLEFQPDVYLLTTQDNDVRRTITRLIDYAIDSTYLPYDSVRQLAELAVAGGESKVAAERTLREHSEDVLGWFYQEIADRSRAAGVVPVFIYLPGLDGRPDPDGRDLVIAAARRAGFGIIDLSGVYADQERESLIVAEYDFHPNTKGHRLVAGALYRELSERPGLLAGRDTSPR